MFKRSSWLARLFLLVYAFTSLAAPQSELVTLLGYEPSINNRSWENHLFFKRMAEKTGIQFEFEQVGELSAYRERLKNLSQGENLPQVLFKAHLDPITAQDLLNQGTLVDLAPYLEEHAPNLSLLLEKHPKFRAAITLQDGSIPSLPFISDIPAQNAIWINQAWLNALNLELPSNLLEFENVLRAFQQNDPNKNGKKDEIPLSFTGPYDLKYLAHAWGLVGNDFNIFLEGETVRFLPAEESFKDFIVWCRQAFNQGLLDKEGFTQIDTLRRITDSKTSNRYGAFFAPLPTTVVPVEWANQYRIIMPFSHEDKVVYRNIASPVFYGAFALTSACKDIPAMLAWVDYLYSEEGAILASIGLAGEDYIVDGDGSWRLLYQPGDQDYYTNVIIASDQATPGISSEAFQVSYTDPLVGDLTVQTQALADVSVLPFPDFPLTQDEVEWLAPRQAALGRYVDESLARFVLGEWEANDEQFDVFMQGLEDLEMNAFVAFWQQLYDERMEEK